MPAPSASPAVPPPRALAAARGAALLVVIVAVAILSAIAVDLAYSTRVSLLTAANARDDLRAEYLSRSAVQLSRLVLAFQQKLDAASPAGKAGSFRIQVWNVVPIGEAFTDALFGGERDGAAAPGKFDAKLEDEARKVNAQMDGAGNQGHAQLAAFLQLVAPQRYDPLFDREDANGNRVTRTDLAIYLRNWSDSDIPSGYAISTAGTFEVGFGDKNQPYYRGDDPYKNKSARFDSLDELYLVAGIDDAFMAAFGNRLTVFLDKNANRNVNTSDPDEMALNARIMADAPQAKLADPDFPAELAREVSKATFGGLIALTPYQFAQIVASFGIIVNGAYLNETTAASSGFTDRSLVYRIRAKGAAGAAERRTDAVVTFDSLQVKQEPAELGRLLHWREE